MKIRAFLSFIVVCFAVVFNFLWDKVSNYKTDVLEDVYLDQVNNNYSTIKSLREFDNTNFYVTIGCGILIIFLLFPVIRKMFS